MNTYMHRKNPTCTGVADQLLLHCFDHGRLAVRPAGRQVEPQAPTIAVVYGEQFVALAIQVQQP